MSTYTGVYNPKNKIKIGDTVNSWTFVIEYEDGTPIIPDSICMQLKTGFGKLAFEYITNLDELTGEVTVMAIPADVTVDFTVGTYYYDVEYLLKDGSTKTYLEGKLQFINSISNCK